MMNDLTDGRGKSDALVLFGITGDLARKKLFPAVYHMAQEGSLAPNVPVVGVSSSDWTGDQLRERARESITAALGAEPIDEEVFASLASRLSYISGDYRDASTFDNLGLKLQGC